MTTSQITTAMRIANNTAKRTMVEFKGLELVTMDRVGYNSNSEYKITLNPKFHWFLTKDFADLRDGFKPVGYKEYLNSKTISAVSENTPVRVEQQEKQEEREATINQPDNTTELNQILSNPTQQEPSSDEEESIKNIDDTHKGKSTDSKKEVLEAKSLFNNPLISEEDLKDPNGFQYDLEIINNIDRSSNSDQWYCKKNDCKVKDDKWLLMKHICKYKNNK